MQSDQDNSALHAYSATGLIGLLATLLVVGWSADHFNIVGCLPKADAEVEKDDLSKLEAIEASLAYRAKPKAQPQKQKKAPEPPKDKLGATRDENAKPTEKPKDEPITKPDETDPLAKFKRHDDDEDLEVGKTEDPTGDFNDNKFGFAEESKGDPYLGELIGQLLSPEVAGEFPSLASSEGEAVPCLHLDRDGKIVDTKFKTKSGNQEFDDFIERALKKFEKWRNADDNEDRKPVPSKLYPLVDEGWICFKIAP